MIWCTQGSICILKQVDHSKFPIQIKTAGKLWRPFLWGLLSLFPKEMYFFGAGRKKWKSGEKLLTLIFLLPKNGIHGRSIKATPSDSRINPIFWPWAAFVLEIWKEKFAENWQFYKWICVVSTLAEQYMGNPLSKIKKQKSTHDFQFVITYLSGDAVQTNMLGSCVLCSRGFWSPW